MRGWRTRGTCAVVIGGTPGAITAGLNTAASCPPRGAGTAPDHTDPTTEATTRHANATPATTSTSRRPSFAARTLSRPHPHKDPPAPSAPAPAEDPPAQDPPAEPVPPTPTLAPPQPVDAQVPPAPNRLDSPRPSHRVVDRPRLLPPEVVRAHWRRPSNGGYPRPRPRLRHPRTERHQVLARSEPVPGGSGRRWPPGRLPRPRLGYSVRRFPPVCRPFLVAARPRVLPRG